MSESVRLEIEFPQTEGAEKLTPEQLSDSVNSLFLAAGITQDAITDGVQGVDLHEAGPLAVDPGTAAVLVAVIGLSIELIKLGVDLAKHERDSELKDRELELKWRELAQKQKEFEAQKSIEKKPDHNKLLQGFIEELLLARLRERHGIQPTRIDVVIEPR